MKKVAVCLLMVLLLTGCTPTDKTGGPVSAQRDSVNLSTTAHLQTLDPHGTSLTDDQMVRAQMYEGLVYFHELTCEISPLLAESYTVSEDGTVYTFKLREDVKFHNGDNMLASDVVFSLKRAKDSVNWGAYAASIKDIVAKDDHTVDVILKRPAADILINLSRLHIVSEREVTEQGDEFGTKVALAGTGPYFMTYLKNDEKWTMEAFPEYYRGEAKIKYINWRPIIDTSAGLIALETGELDWYRVPTANWNSLVNNPNLETELMIGNHVTFLAVNYAANDKLGNDNIRKAIAYCIDKEAINLAAFDGLGLVTDCLISPKYNVGAPEPGIAYNYDPDKAKALLAEAGYPDGVDVGTIITYPGDYFEKCAQVVQANMAAVGIHADLEIIEQASLVHRVNTQDYDISIYAWTLSGDYSIMRLRAHSDSVGAHAINFKGDKFDYKRIDALIEESSAELDPDKRLELTGELNDIIMDTACLIPFVFTARPYAWNKDLNVVNYPIIPRVYEWSWK